MEKLLSNVLNGRGREALTTLARCPLISENDTLQVDEFGLQEIEFFLS